MSIWNEIETSVENVLGSLEEGTKQAVLTVLSIFKPLGALVLPDQLQILWQVVKDVFQGLTQGSIKPDEGDLITAVFNDLEAKELDWWKKIEPSIQANIINALVSLHLISATTDDSQAVS